VLVHGGAGELLPQDVERHHAGCRVAVAAAAAVLGQGGTSLDAVERAVLALEDDPVFNAGTGAVLNEAGLVELDASIMEGARLQAGAVCALPPFAHPIAIARAALEDGRHVLYAGEGAERFALEKGFVRVTSEAMTTGTARERWAAARARMAIDSPALPAHGPGGTVGAVAVDTRGSVAAATSTGGISMKRAGRVGDSPMIGAGNYADDDLGACSATGHGESAMRVCLARSAVDLLRARVDPEEAAAAVIRSMTDRVGGHGGVILVDRFGRLGLAHNTAHMTWAAAAEHLDGEVVGA
jgi:beta-aspartyl-peptidase (threonine type)